jgi:uncharacterized surface protein with fasciclin (FAS1) repeats
MNNSNSANASTTNLVDTVATQGTLSTFSKAIAAAGLSNVLNGAGPYTVFAPTDAAFEKLPAGQLDGWLKPENRSELISVLKYHVSPGRTSSEQVGNLTETKTMEGQIASIKKDGDKITIGSAHITTPDVASSNGILHVIDAVLVPTKH